MALPVPHPVPIPPEASAPLSQLIPSLEDLTWRALSNTGADILPYLSPTCVMQFPVGLRVSATSEPSLDAVMRSEAFLPWIEYKLSDVEVVELGPGVALIRYTAWATREAVEKREREVEFNALCVSVWKRDGGGVNEEGLSQGGNGNWLMEFHQQTPFDLL